MKSFFVGWWHSKQLNNGKFPPSSMPIWPKGYKEKKGPIGWTWKYGGKVWKVIIIFMSYNWLLVNIVKEFKLSLQPI